MFDHKHYVPILTGKLGEYRGLRDLQGNVRTAVTPLLEVPPIDWNYADDVPAKTMDEQISDVAENIYRNWGAGNAFVDTFQLQDNGATANGVNPLAHILNQARNLGLSLIPVTSIDRSPAHQLAVTQAVSSDQRGCCIRLTTSQIRPDLGTQLSALMTELGITHDTTDLLIDFGPMNPAFESTYRFVIQTLVNTVNQLGNWRTLTVSGSAFPNDLRDVPPNSVHGLRRTEWHSWKSAIESEGLDRQPTYSDYSIDSPEYVSLDFRIIRQSAAIRYTHEDEWIIVKGRVIQKGAPSQYPELAAILRDMYQYMGRDFSMGDMYIDDVASGVDGPGNATTWRQVGTNHHVTFVVRQLASFFAS